jgi:WD40 repeat protein
MSMTKLMIAAAALVVALVGFSVALQTGAVTAADKPTRSNPSGGPAGRRPPPRADLAWKVGPTLQGHGGQVYRVRFSPDGKQLASGSGDKSVVVWDVAKREQKWTLSCDGVVLDVAFAPDGKTLATASGTDNDAYLIKLWDPATEKERATLAGQAHPIHWLRFAREGRTLVSASSPINVAAAGADRGEVCFWDVGTRTKLATLRTDLVHGALLSPDGKKLATAGSVRGETVKLLDIGDKFAPTRETVLEQDVSCGLELSPDGKAFVVAPVSDPSVVTLREFATGKVLRSFEHKSGSVRTVAFAPDGRTLATGCWVIPKDADGGKPRTKEAEVSGEVRFWDVTTGEERQPLREKLPPVTSLAFSPDGRTLAVGLLHKEVVKLAKGDGFEPPADRQAGVVVLYELR